MKWARPAGTYLMAGRTSGIRDTDETGQMPDNSRGSLVHWRVGSPLAGCSQPSATQSASDLADQAVPSGEGLTRCLLDAMEIDNQIYDRIGDSWWDETSPLNVLNGSFTPGRFAYFRAVLDRIGLDPAGLRALDIGCGGGFMAEEFARLGCRVVGVDPSPVSIRTARQHAESSALKIGYAVATGEQLPLDRESFDLAYCCDVLEHVSNLDLVIKETARVLKPGGLYLFDTINRTTASKVLAVKVLQDWRLTRVVDTQLHSWEMFIKPTELEEILRRHALRLGEITGLGPRSNKAALLWNFVQARRGRITFGRLSKLMDVGQVKDTAVSYMGYATKAA
jgi:2-polyprenyl-6-hydroxyphenyl methylase/3-demethylubiquinone-9 3-methyltransferase